MKRTEKRTPTTTRSVDAAARAILLRGFPSCTMRLVAEQANLPLERVRAEFPRKDGLVKAIVDRAAGLFTTPMDAPVTANTDRERLTELLTKQLAVVDANREVFLVAVTRHFRPDEYPIVPPLSGSISRLQLYFTKLEDWIRKHLAATDAHDPALRAHLVGGAVVGLLVHWAGYGGRRHASGYTSAVVRTITSDA